MPDTFPFARGTKTVRRTTASLTPGTQVLTQTLTGRYTEGDVVAAQVKTGAVVRTVDHRDAVAGRSTGGHRAQRTYTVHFTDGTRAEGNAPVYSWHALATDA